MGQLYYPPRQNSLDFAKLGLQLYGIKKRTEIDKGKLDVAKQQQALAERTADAEYGFTGFATPGSAEDRGGPLVNMPGGDAGTVRKYAGLKQQNIDAMNRRTRVWEKQQALDEKKFQVTQEQIDAANKPVTPGQFAAIEAGLPSIANHLGFAIDKPSGPYLNDMKNLTEQGYKRRDLYEHTRNNWDYYKPAFIDQAKKDLAIAVNQNDTKKAGQITKAIDAMGSPDFVDMFYPNAARVRVAEEYQKEIGRKEASAKLMTAEAAKESARPGLTPSQQNTEYQRLRTQIAKDWGYSDLSGIDPDTSKKIEESTVLARQLYNSGLNMDAARKQANDYVRTKYKYIEKVPKANTGRWNNKDETKQAITPLLTMGMATSEVLGILVDQGWKKQEAIELIKETVKTLQNANTNQ